MRRYTLEKCIQAVRDMQRFVMLVARRVNEKLKKMVDREAYLQKLEDRVDGELTFMADPAFCEQARHAISQGKCRGEHRSTFCDFKLVKRSAQPMNCAEIATRARQQKDVYGDICCGFFTKIGRFFKQIIIFIVKAGRVIPVTPIPKLIPGT